MKTFAVTIALGLAAWLNPAELIAQKRLDDKNLQQGRLPAGFYAPLPQVTGWQGDDKLLVRMRRDNDTVARQYVMDVKTGNMTLQATPAIYIPPRPEIISRNNDLYLRMDRQERRLTNDPAEEKNPTFSPDSTRIAFTRNNDLYTIELASGRETRLTNDGTQTLLNGYATWVYWEEIFGRPTRFRAFWWSPDSRTLAYMRFDENKIPMFPLYVADGTHGHIEETRYPKAGDPNPAVKLGFVNADGGSTTWVNFGEETSHQLGWPKWTPDGKTLYVQWQNRGQDTLRMYAVNPGTGGKTQVYEEIQPTWIDLSEADERITFLNNGRDMLIQSDKTGWNHLYLYSADGRFRNAVTAGKYRVTGIDRIDEKAGIIYFRARHADRSAETGLYSVRLNGTGLTQISPPGQTVINADISPGGKHVAITHSNLTTPPTVSLFDAKGKLIRRLGSAGDGSVKDYALARTELIRIPSADGKFQLPAIVTWPDNMEPGKRYPMLVSIYGGPDAGTVRDAWSWTPQREWYAREGLIQVAFDHRASGHFGKEGVNWMHRNLGHWELEDYMTMARWFIDRGFADPERIGITGFSYGGYMTALALTKGADVFTHGMAGGSVTDWHLYDSHYTERYMDTPAENPEGYKVSSVMHYADRYKGKLLIIHGTMDDNVHMQNSIQLVGALQDKGKDFELMLYPNGRHGWRNLPERHRHYMNLQTKFIYRNLLRKEAPAELMQ